MQFSDWKWIIQWLIYSELSYSHHGQLQNNSFTPQRNPVPISNLFLHFLQLPRLPVLGFLSLYRFVHSGLSFEWIQAIQSLLWTASFPSHNVFRVNPKNPPLYECTALYWFVSWGTSGLFQLWGLYELCCYEHLWTAFCMDMLSVGLPRWRSGRCRRHGVPSLGWEDPLEEGVATHSSIPAWRISRTESLAGYSPRGRQESDTTDQLSMHFNSQM